MVQARRKKGYGSAAVSEDSSIREIRGERVILDSDLALLYGVSTARLNEAVKRNRDRFPEDFMFQLTRGENGTLISQIAISKTGRGGRRTLPFAFTEHGAIMAASLLNSARAIHMSIFVVRAFIRMRQTLAAHTTLSQALIDLEQRLSKRLDVQESAIVYVLEELKKLMEPVEAPTLPRRPIGFGPSNE
jgi:hypothetical protein